jgi:DNA ligase-1
MIWNIRAEDHKGKAAIVTEYGYEEGEVQSTLVLVENGKNVGRSNETTPFEQACSEAEAKWTKKKDKKYVEKKKDLEKDQRILPMLAHNYKKRGHDIEWPAFLQPKLNGIRCLAQKVSPDEIRYLSRGGKQFGTLDHLTPHLLQILNTGEILDGELFTTALTFQEIVAAVKREKTANPNTSRVEYWVYDIVQADASFEERNRRLLEMLPREGPIVTVPTLEAKSEGGMRKLHAKFVQAGYEGTIIRNKQGLYRCKYRSADLQKFKDFIDEEFTIIGGKEGVGRAKGTITWTCETEDGKPFDARPRGTEEQRRHWWKNLNQYVGQKLTVRYQNRSDDNIPIFPVGVSIREGAIDKDGDFQPDF